MRVVTTMVQICNYNGSELYLQWFKIRQDLIRKVHDIFLEISIHFLESDLKRLHVSNYSIHMNSCVIRVKTPQICIPIVKYMKSYKKFNDSVKWKLISLSDQIYLTFQYCLCFHGFDIYNLILYNYLFWNFTPCLIWT